MVIRQIAGEDALQMPRMEDDHVVQTRPADTPNQPLDTGMLPWTPWGDQDFFAPHVPHALPNSRSIHAIPIAQQGSWDIVPRQCLQHLLGRPRCGGMLGDMEGHDTAPLMGANQQPNQHLGGRRRDGEAVEGHAVWPVMVQKRRPRRRWRRSPRYPIRLPRGLGHLEAQLAQLAYSSRCPPRGVRSPRLPDQRAHFLGHGRTTGLAALPEASPLVAASRALPGYDGTRLDECSHIVPTGPQPGPPGPADAIARRQAEPADRLLRDRHLMRDRQDLQVERPA